MAAYEAPFPEERYKAGARQFPLLVPTRPDDPAADANRAAWDVRSVRDNISVARNDVVVAITAWRTAEAHGTAHSR